MVIPGELVLMLIRNKVQFKFGFFTTNSTFKLLTMRAIWYKEVRNSKLTNKTFSLELKSNYI